MKKLILLSALLLLSGCKKDEAPMQPEPVVYSVNGSWSGLINTDNNRAITMEFSIAQADGKITGSGTAQLAGSIVKDAYEVSGTIKGNVVYLIFREMVVFFDGTISGSIMTGQVRGLAKNEVRSFVKK